MENQLELFLKNWDSFENVVKGALLTEASKSSLTFSRAKMVLAKESMAWQNDLASAGFWLSEYQKIDETKGKEIRRILTEDMKFSEEKAPSVLKTPKYIGAIGGAAIGYGIAKVAEWGTCSSTIATVLPMAICFIGGNSFATTKNKNAVNNVIDAYCFQLEAFKNSVVAIINA